MNEEQSEAAQPKSGEKGSTLAKPAQEQEIPDDAEERYSWSPHEEPALEGE